MFLITGIINFFPFIVCEVLKLNLEVSCFNLKNLAIPRGYSNWATAKEMRVSEKFVEAKLTCIYEKLNLQSDAKRPNLRVAAVLHFYGLAWGPRASRG